MKQCSKLKFLFFFLRFLIFTIINKPYNTHKQRQKTVFVCEPHQVLEGKFQNSLNSY